MQKLVKADQPIDIDTEEALKLSNMGLVKYSGNKVVMICDLYRRYFGDRLKSIS